MPKLTHKGWFLFCPVLLADIETDCPYMETRRFVPEWWFEVNAAAVEAFLSLVRLTGCEPMYPIVITGEIGAGNV